MQAALAKPCVMLMARSASSGNTGYVRHPMYAGLILAAFGLAAVSHSETRLALAAMLWWILEQKVCGTVTLEHCIHHLQLTIFWYTPNPGIYHVLYVMLVHTLLVL